MSARLLLARHLRDVLGATVVLAGLTGCDKILDEDTSDDFNVELDDEACLVVSVDDECPSAEDAAAQLVGTETCEDPVREIVATGELLERRDITGGWYYDTGWTAQHEHCCYEAAYEIHPDEGCAIGRPLVLGETAHTAPAVVRPGWSRGVRPELAGLSESAKHDLAHFWTAIGLMEHASVASFARFSLELIAHGAPPALLAAAHAAAADEVRHAEAALALASAFAGRPIGPGALPQAALGGTRDLVELAVATAREACIGETLSVVLAAEQLRTATDPAVRQVLARIIEDETRHAELGWDTVRWILAICPEAREPVAEIFAHAEDHLPSIAPFARGGEQTVAHGLPSVRRLQAALEAGLVRVVEPAARELLG